LKSLYQFFGKEIEREEYEIIVVDNGSNDGSIEYIRRGRPPGRPAIGNGQTGRFVPTIIENKQNLGFAKANNIGIYAAHGDLILLLNSDTEVKQGAIQGMVKFFEEREGNRGDGGEKWNMGAATCRILLPDGKIDPACHRGFPTPWNAFCYFAKLEKIFPKIKLFSGYHQTYKNLKTIHEVDAISGAFFFDE